MRSIATCGRGRNIRVDLDCYVMDTESVAYRQGLVDRLNEYERAFHEKETYNLSVLKLDDVQAEKNAHRIALGAAGLLDDGLRMGRVYAGLPNTAAPGIIR